ncbi:MAG: hypothetical protein HZC41_26895 [Chloroflexi bacterium]|nr:hypothetical protein [Chloroflexota bacterium]
MTYEELKQLIVEVVDVRLNHRLGSSELDEESLPQDALDNRTWDEVKRDVERHRWTPPPGTPSVTQLLREDRDR